jgi:hypothetical protein
MLNMYWKVLVYTLLVVSIITVFYNITRYEGFLFVLGPFLFTVTLIKTLEIDKELEKLKSKKLIEKENN